jgi:hypothetical protein
MNNQNNKNIKDNINLEMDNNSDDDIREPDKIIVEKLIDDDIDPFIENEYTNFYNDNTSNDNELNEALKMSSNEFNTMNHLQQEYENKIINDFLNETENRKIKFKPLLSDINRVASFDKEIKEIYNILEPIIESYCEQQIEIIELDKITYEKIFKNLSTIRSIKNNIDLLKGIICFY